MDTTRTLRPTSPPIFQTATFAQASATEFGEFDYSRSGNPTRRVLEAELACLEGGERAFAFTSGMAAIATLLGGLRAGDRLITGADLYGGSVRYIERVLAARGVGIEVVDTRDLASVQTRLAASSARTLVFLETPSNPLLAVSDLAALSALTRAAGATLAVDNTMLSPALQRPLELGVDLVVHSATKHLGGHGDLTAGCLIAGATAHGAEWAEELAFRQNAEGNALGPFDAWLLLRGLKTLRVRLAAECASAQVVAEALAAHPRVRRVHYPGLASHPGAALNARQARGAGCVLSFETGDAELSRRWVEATRRFAIAVSFGCVSSSISLPYCMSHASVPRGSQRALPPRDLVRLSVGLEPAAELVEDLERAFERAGRERPGVSVGRSR